LSLSLQQVELHQQVIQSVGHAHRALRLADRRRHATPTQQVTVDTCGNEVAVTRVGVKSGSEDIAQSQCVTNSVTLSRHPAVLLTYYITYQPRRDCIIGKFGDSERQINNESDQISANHALLQ